MRDLEDYLALAASPSFRLGMAARLEGRPFDYSERAGKSAAVNYELGRLVASELLEDPRGRAVLEAGDALGFAVFVAGVVEIRRPDGGGPTVTLRERV